jgi:endo-1,4-beta-xylanase
MPAPVEVITSVFENGDFEGTGGGWVPVGNCTTTTSGDQAYSGQASLFTTQRTQAWEGPGYYLLDKATPGATYEVVAWVRTDEGAASLNLTYKHTCPGDGDGVYTQLVTRGVGTAWTELKGVLVVPSCELFESVVFVVGALGGVGFYMVATSRLRAGS